MSGRAGAVAWAVVPYSPQAPFRIYAGTDRKPFTVDGPGKLIAAARKGGDSDMTYLVTGKVRPILILSDAHSGDLGEYLGLRLSRFSKLTAQEAGQVREQKHQTLFHLRPAKFPKLQDENAAMIAALVRVHRSAIDTETLGRLDAHELAIVHQRLVRFHGFDLRMLIKERIEELTAAHQARQNR